MLTVAIWNFKGGSFKTTATHTLATGLALLGKRVLVIDTDPQAHTTQMLGLKPKASLYDLLVRNAPLNEVIDRAPKQLYDPEKRAKGEVIVIRSNDETGLIPMKMNDPLLLRDKVEALDNIVDFALIDTSPTPSLLSAVINIAADGVIYPTKCEALHLDGLVRAIEYTERINDMRGRVNLTAMRSLGILPAIFRRKTLEHTDLLKSLLKEYQEDVWKPIPDSILWAEAARNRQPIFTYAPNSNAAQAGLGMVDEFLERVSA